MAQEEEPSSSSLDDIPTVRGLNLSMPAEWAPHRACLILYPHNPQTFRLGNYRAQGEAQLRNGNAQAQVLQVAHAICHQGHETVYLLATNDAQAQELRQTSIVLASEDKIQVYVCPSNDTWVRDTGPTCCWSTTATTTTTDTATTQLIGLDWEFNAYGGPEEGCYWPCDLDQQVARRVCHDLLQNIPCYKVPLILEGGSIHTDGEGTLLVTKECLLHPNRNPTRSQDDIDLILKHTLGVETVLWLPLGLDADDDTNGHVDNFCCFVKPGHVVLAWTDDQVHDMGNYQRCRQAESFLLSCQDAKGRSLQVHKLQLPPPLVCMFLDKRRV
jgi:agmatine deiminase